MIVKSFISDTVAGALKRARTELGGDAVILKTRRLEGVSPASAGGKVEVTACVDRPTATKTLPVALREPVAETPAKPKEPNRLFVA